VLLAALLWSAALAGTPLAIMNTTDVFGMLLYLYYAPLVASCIKPEAALKVRRHKTMEICNLSTDENYELILECKMRNWSRVSKQECSKQLCYIH
jgi:hypothetical protein